MAVGIPSADRVSRGRDVLNADTAGHILIGGDGGWVAELGEGKDQDQRGQGAPEACGILLGLGEEKRETPRVKPSVNETGGWLGQLYRGVGWLASALKKRFRGREPCGIVSISLFQNEVGGRGTFF